MYICMYVCMWVCVYVCMYVCMTCHVYVYIRIHGTYVCMYVCMYIYICVKRHAMPCVCMYVYVYMPCHVYVYIHIIVARSSQKHKNKKKMWEDGRSIHSSVQLHPTQCKRRRWKNSYSAKPAFPISLVLLFSFITNK